MALNAGLCGRLLFFLAGMGLDDPNTVRHTATLKCLRGLRVASPAPCLDLGVSHSLDFATVRRPAVGHLSRSIANERVVQTQWLFQGSSLPRRNPGTSQAGQFAPSGHAWNRR